MAFRDADPDRARNVLQRGLVIATDSGNRAYESHIAVTLARLEAEYGPRWPRSNTPVRRSALGSTDLVHSGPDWQIEVAYPFSRQPTGHALGIPLMTGTDGVIDSADPNTGTPIRIHRHSDEWTWQPATAVVVIAQTDCSETLADTVCGSITFHTDRQHAHSHLDHHPELHGHIIGQAAAICLADCAFRGLLASGPIHQHLPNTCHGANTCGRTRPELDAGRV
jgi:hypothetical protein